MPIQITCAGCSSSLQVKDEYAGKRCKCPKCQAINQIPTHGPRVAAAPAPVGAAWAKPVGAAQPAQVAATQTLRSGTAQSATAESSSARIRFAIPMPATETLGRQTGPAAIDPAQRGARILAAFTGPIVPVRTPVLYRLGIVVVAFAMVLLPLIYLAIVGLVAYALYYHATAHVVLFKEVRNAKAALFVYLAPLIAGGIMLFFMMKPLFARRAVHDKPRSLDPEQEPLVCAFVDRVCAVVGAPAPGRIDVDCQVNASAGFARGVWSMFTNDLVLTIGLPLVSGLSLGQFAGVLAHEFGHFTQRTGMRLTYLIRSISFWFMRVVYERDAWDEQLVAWANESDWRIAIVFHFARLLVWLTRRVLWLLMMVGHAISCFMLRQMEYDADRHAARLAGSDVFGAASLRINLLSVATQGAHADLYEGWKEGRLADDFPALIVCNIYQIPPDARSAIEKHVAETKTGLLDTHPSDRDRIASVQAEAAPGCFRFGGPATVLFGDFPKLCKKSTWDFYREALGGTVKRESLYPVADMVRRQEATQEGHKAIRRFFQDAFSVLRPLPLPAEPPGAPTDSNAAGISVRNARNRTAQAAVKYASVLKRYDAADTRTIQAEAALALIGAGLKIKPGEFSLTAGSLDAAETAQQQAAGEQQGLAPGMDRYEQDLARRLYDALRLLHAPQLADQVSDAARWRDEIAALYPAAVSLNGMLTDLVQLGRLRTALGGLLGNVEGNEQNQELYRAIMTAAGRVHGQLQELSWRLTGVAYPFEHAKGRVTLADFALPQLPERDAIGELYQAAGDVLEKLVSLNYRLLGRLVLAAEQVELSLGMPPLPEPAQTQGEEPEEGV